MGFIIQYLNDFVTKKSITNIICISLMVTVLQATKQIAIIGAGIGGISTSFFLSDLFTKDQINVDLYEANKVGGRVACDTINGLKFDTGAPILHEEQQHMSHFRDLLGLKRRKSYLRGGLGYFDGKTYLAHNETLFTPTIAELNKYVDDLLSKFRRIYNQQKEKKSFKDVHSMMKGLDPQLIKTLTVSLREAVMKRGFPEYFIDIFVAAGTYRDYQMGPYIHQFAGTYAQGTSQPRLWQVEGGNCLITQGLLKKSRVNLIMRRVQKVQLNSDGKFKVTTNSTSKTYDFVVIATPITEDHKNPIVFKNFPQKIHVPGIYRPLHNTILRGKLNPKYFGLTNQKELPLCVMNVGGSLFNILCQIAPVNSKKTKDVYYVIDTNTPIPAKELDKMFLEKSHVHAYSWLANPSYDISGRNDKFVLHKNLFHINAVEWIASGMEMSCIAGKNIVNHIYSTIFTKNQTINYCT